MPQPVFISYARVDHDIVSRIITALQEAGVPVWIDHQKLKPGTSNWELSIRDAIAEAPAFILIASPNTVQSQYVPDEISIAQLRTPTIPIIPVWIAGKNYIEAVPMGMGRVQGLDLRDKAFDTNVGELIAILREVAGAGKRISSQYILPVPTQEAVPADFVPHNPYQGLAAFTEKTSRYYFGRTALVNTLAERLQKERFLAVVGASGSGKSSVVMAGLLPKLRQEHPEWVILPTMKPGAQPVEELAIVLASQRQTAAISVRPDLESADSRGLHLQSKMVSRDSRVVLVIDQFEELFTLTMDEKTRERFVNLITTAATAPDGNLSVVLTLRADFSDRPLAYLELGRLISEHNEPVLPMSLAELTEVVLGPAALDDVRMMFEDDLASRLVYAVREQPGGLPLLQFALDQLFQRRDEQKLTIRAYEETGELKGALAKHADATYASLPSELHRQMARGLFLRLISPGATEQDSTRRRVMQHELKLADPEQRGMMDKIVQMFITARLLTTGEIAGEPTLEVSHEALIREWNALRTWLDQFRNEVRLQQRISQDAADWLQRGKRPDDLYLGEKLGEAEAWRRSGAFAVSGGEAEFIETGVNRQLTLREEDERRIKALHEAEAKAEKSQQQALRTRRGLQIAIALAILIVLPLIVALQIQGTLATTRENQANMQVANAQSTIVEVGTSVAETLTPIPATLTQVADDMRDGQARIESLRLAALTNGILSESYGNVEAGAIIGIRALKTVYTAQADAALIAALSHLYAQRTLSDGTSDIVGVAFSPDSRFVLVTSDNKVKLWDVATGQALRTFSGHTNYVFDVEFSPDGRTVLTGSGDNTAKLWDVTTGQELRTFNGHVDSVNSVAFSPDGLTVLTGSADGTVKLWDAATGKLLHTFSRHAEAVYSVAFSPDGLTVLAGLVDNTAELWNTVTEQEIRSFRGHTSYITSVAFSPNGRYILTGSGDKTARLWDVTTGQELRTFNGHAAWVSSVAFSYDGRYVVTGLADNTAELWDAMTGQALRTFSGHTGTVDCIAFSPDGHYVITGSADGTAKLWDTTVEQESSTRRILKAGINSIAFSPNGRYILMGLEGSTAELWDTIIWQKTRTFSGNMSHISSVAFSPDGRTVLIGSGTNLIDNTASLWDIATGKERVILRGHDYSVTSVAFSPDGRTVLTGSEDGTAKLWNTVTGQEIRSFDTQSISVTSVAFSPDGHTMLTGSEDGTAKLWNTVTGQEIRSLSGHTFYITSAAFSPDGHTVLTGSGDKTAKLWDVATGQELRTFSGHMNGISSAAFSPDGHTVLTGSGDKTAKLWDVATGQELRTFSGHIDAVTSVAFSPDGHNVLTGSWDKTVHWWEPDYRDFVIYACTRVTRDFTKEERSQFHILDNEPTCPQFATTDNPVSTPFPPTATRFPVTLPVWTPIASATITFTPTKTPIASPTP